MIILLNQDSVLADFEEGFRTAWTGIHPDIAPVGEPDRKSFQVRDDYPTRLQPEVDAIIHSRGFYRHLPLVRGAVHAVNQLLAEGIEVFICTSPLSQYQNCIMEKYEWVEEHLGSEFTKRVILSRDKTLVQGDVLIDDKPEIHGLATPHWYPEGVTDEAPVRGLQFSLTVKPDRRWYVGWRLLAINPVAVEKVPSMAETAEIGWPERYPEVEKIVYRPS